NTLKNVIKTFEIKLRTKTIAFIGLGSIGKAALFSMLSNMEHPEKIILADLYTNERSLLEIEKQIYELFNYKGKVNFYFNAEPDNTLYLADIMVTAVSKPGVINVDQLKPGTIV